MLLQLFCLPIACESPSSSFVIPQAGNLPDILTTPLACALLKTLHFLPGRLTPSYTDISVRSICSSLYWRLGEASFIFSELNFTRAPLARLTFVCSI
uniref:Uncharacterized protein n=1 Tax=Arundo donax TaxID=35708 RepID=A0A0A9AZ50_ARUDO